jgi:predicted ATPase/DNA-binding XRE family transcriptional regulator
VDKTLTFGDLLRRYREKAHLTQEELAERAGLTPQAISMLERGERRRPQRYTVQKLVETLQLSPQDGTEFEAVARLSRTVRSTTTPPRRSFPIPPTTLIGRRREVADVTAILREMPVRLLTLTGPGGVGKTRLALQVAAELLYEYADGVHLVALAPIQDPNLVASVVARELGLTESGGGASTEDLKTYLREKQTLLVLDNFEQILDAGPLVTELLAGCTFMKVLVTTRTVLRVRGERQFLVSPLPVPAAGQPSTVAAVSEFESVQLFIERVRDSGSALQLTEENATTVAEICRRLDGLPLAIELAAPRLRLLPFKVLAEQLGNALQLLTGGLRDLPARQRTLRATIDWSYGLLEPGEKLLFSRLAVFTGGWTLEGAAAVCYEKVPSLAILDGMASLLDKGMVQRFERSIAKPRFTMLETIREYALERLAESASENAIHRRHARFFLDLAEQAEPHLRGENQRAWLKRLEEEHDNLREALRWALNHDVADTGLRLIGSLRWFWTFRSHVNEGYEWALAMLERSPAGQATASRAKALWTAGVMAWFRQDPMARHLLEESVAVWRELGDERGLGYALQHLGLVVSAQGDYGTARLMEEESLGLFQATDDRHGIALATLCLAFVQMKVHEVETAQMLLQDSAQLSREIGDRWALTLALDNLGALAKARGDYTEGCALLSQCIELWWEMGTKHEIARVLNVLGEWAYERGDIPQATHLCGAVDVLSDDIGASREKLYHASYLDSLRTVLGDEQFATLWREGREMPLDRVLDLLCQP